MSAAGTGQHVPQAVVDKVNSSECILFLGAMASAATSSEYGYPAGPPSGGQLSDHLATICQYPGTDRSNLMRVSLHFELQKKLGLSRQELVAAVRREIQKDDIQPSPALKMLAALPFRVIITTNYDKLFDSALGDAYTRSGKRKRPLPFIYSPKEPAATNVPLDPTEESPVLFKLHGDIDKPQSIVITEEDYITFIQRMGNPHPASDPIPGNIRARMGSWSILFIGYSLKDWNLRLLLRALRWHVDAANYGLSYSVDPTPDDLIVAVLQDVERPVISFLREDLWDFVPELYERCLGSPWPR
jgi:hypothetical protein